MGVTNRSGCWDGNSRVDQDHQSCTRTGFGAKEFSRVTVESTVRSVAREVAGPSTRERPIHYYARDQHCCENVTRASWKRFSSFYILLLLLVPFGLLQTAAALVENANEFGFAAALFSTRESLLCRIIVMDTVYQGLKNSLRGEEHTECVPIVNDKESHHTLSIQLPPQVFKHDELDVRLGGLVISISGAYIIEGSSVVLTEWSHVDVVDHARFDRQLASAGTMGRRRVLVIRISLSDSSLNKTAAELESTLFGDGTNFVSQYRACSFGKLQWVKANAGVIDVHVDAPVGSFQSSGEVIGAAGSRLVDMMGVSSPNELADNVLFCVPGGTGDWAASAGVNYWRSQFNNDWCTSLTATMHELGHNIGLLHANLDGMPYGDSTGYMAAGYRNIDWPRKCFNGQNNWHLDWYSNKQVRMDPIADGPSLVKIAAFVDYELAKENEPVLVNIMNRFFLQYNRAKGFNSDTERWKDMLTVTEAVNGGTDGRAGLAVLETFRAENFLNSGQDLIIEVCTSKLGDSLSADVFGVSIGLGSSMCEKQRPSARPTTPPTRKPSARPTRYPSVHPFEDPSHSPSSQPHVPPHQPTSLRQRAADAPSLSPSPFGDLTEQPTLTASEEPSDGPSDFLHVAPTGPSSTIQSQRPSRCNTFGEPCVPAPTSEPVAVPSVTPTSSGTQQSPSSTPSTRSPDVTNSGSNFGSVVVPDAAPRSSPRPTRAPYHDDEFGGIFVPRAAAAPSSYPSSIPTQPLPVPTRASSFALLSEQPTEEQPAEAETVPTSQPQSPNVFLSTVVLPHQSMPTPNVEQGTERSPSVMPATIRGFGFDHLFDSQTLRGWRPSTSIPTVGSPHDARMGENASAAPVSKHYSRAFVAWFKWLRYSAWFKIFPGWNA